MIFLTRLKPDMKYGTCFHRLAKNRLSQIRLPRLSSPEFVRGSDTSSFSISMLLRIVCRRDGEVLWPNSRTTEHELYDGRGKDDIMHIVATSIGSLVIHAIVERVRDIRFDVPMLAERSNHFLCYGSTGNCC